MASIRFEVQCLEQTWSAYPRLRSIDSGMDAASFERLKPRYFGQLQIFVLALPYGLRGQ